VDRRVCIPDVEIGIEHPKLSGIVTYRLYDDARLARFALRRLLHPMPNVAANSAFVIE
jgi:hypothetical protein